MGKVSARNLILTRTRPRGASATPILPSVKLACGQCVKSFIRRGDLKRHEQLHTGVKNHECTVCGKRFSQNSGLKTHMNVHTGNKPYRCAFEGCGAEFGDPSSHARHKKETHVVDYRYECPLFNGTEKCGSAIKRRSAFAQHLKKKHDVTATSSELDSMKKVFRPPTSQRRKANHVDVPRRTVAPAFTPTLVQPHYVDTFDRNYGTWDASPNLFDHKLDTELFYGKTALQQGDSAPTFSAPSGSASSTDTLIAPWKHLKHEHFDPTLVCEYPADFPPTVDAMAHLPPSISPSPPYSPDGFSVPSTPLSLRDMQKIAQSPHIQSPHIHYERQLSNQHAAAGSPSHAPYQFVHNSYEISQEKEYVFPQPQFGVNGVQSWPTWDSHS